MSSTPDDVSSKAGISAEVVRQFLIEVALRAHQDAGLAGLCAEGRWEAAIGAMRSTALPVGQSPADSKTE